MRMKIHSRGIRGSSMIKEGEEPGVMFGCLLEIDGELYDKVNDIEANFGDTFATVTVTFIPGTMEVITHTEDSWNKLQAEALARETRIAARNNHDRFISVYVSPSPDDE